MASHAGAKVYIYTRVSTSVQVDGYSLAAQRGKLRKYAEYEDMTVVGEYSDEGFSGKNIQGRLDFQRMLDDIQTGRDGVSFVLVFKLSRFGRNAADVLNSLQLMQDFGVNLICVEDGIDSSRDSGKLVISVLSAVAEIERENILVQTMAGRQQKAMNGGWNGGFAPYGYELVEGRLVIAEDEADIIRLIYDKFVHTTMGANGVAAWLNDHGYRKKVRQNGKLEVFTAHFVKLVLDNPVYMGKIAYGRRRNEKIPGKRNEYHIVKQDSYSLYNGMHDSIVPEELWKKAHAKRVDTGVKSDKKEKEHEYILSGLIRCPGCGAPMYGIPSRSKKRKDGTPYPPYYSYVCRTKISETGQRCPWHRQVSAKRIDAAVRDIIVSLVAAPEFEKEIKKLIGKQVDLRELQEELVAYQKQFHQTVGTQRKLEQQLDALDPEDSLYEHRYESLDRRLTDIFFRIDELKHKIDVVETRIKNVEQEKLSRDSVYEYLLLFEHLYDKMTDREKKDFMQSFIRSIEIFPEKQSNGQQIKTIHFRFPVLCGNAVTDEISLPFENHVETVVLLSKGEIDSKKVRVEFSLEDMDMSGFQKGATYEQIKAYVLEKFELKVSSLYISQIKRKCGLDVGQNYNLSKKENAKVPKCPPEKEAAIMDALKYFQMIM